MKVTTATGGFNNGGTRAFMKWSGIVLFAIASVFISVYPNEGGNWIPFFGFAVGHFLWFGAGALMNDRALMVLNGMYLPIDVYAVYVRL